MHPAGPPVLTAALTARRYNKQVLTALRCPLTITAFQFFMGSLMSLTWFAATRTRIDLSKATVAAVAPLAVVHVLGNLLTNVSLGLVAVSFTHTIKAMEPLFSVILSAAFLGERAHPLVLATLLPIIGGVIGASVSEVSFNWGGFGSAMASNLTFQSRNVFSKRSMTPEVKQRVCAHAFQPPGRNVAGQIWARARSLLCRSATSLLKAPPAVALCRKVPIPDA